MATWLIVVIAVVAVVLIALLLMAMKRARARRAIERERLTEQAGGHRTESERHAEVADRQRARADELAQEATRYADELALANHLDALAAGLAAFLGI